MTGRLRIELTLWLVVLIWAGNYTVAKFGVLELSPLAFTALRFLIVTPLLYIPLKLREGRLDFPRGEWPRVLLVGLVGIVAYHTTFMAAIKHTTSTNVALGLGLSPIFTALLGAATGQERLHGGGLAGCLVAFVGIYLVVAYSPAQTTFVSHTLYGDFLALAAGFLWGLYPIVSLPLMRKHSALWLFSHSSLAATIILLGLALPELVALPVRSVSWPTWLSLLYAAIPCTVLAILAWYSGIEKIGANQVMVYMYLVPPLAMVIAMLAIDERVALAQAVGAGITLSGVALVKRSRLG